MRSEAELGVIALPPNVPLRVHHGYGRRIVCVRGAVWITQHRDTRDVILRSGEEHVIDRRGLAIVQALDGVAWIAHEQGIRIAPPAPGASLRASAVEAAASVR